MAVTEQDLVSVVIPMFDEADNVEPLSAALIQALNALGRPYEVIFIDDGSLDGTSEKLATEAESNSRIKVIAFKRTLAKPQP